MESTNDVSKEEGKEFGQGEQVREEWKTGEEGKAAEEGEVGKEKAEYVGKEGKDEEEGKNAADSVVESKMERATCYEYGVHHSGFPLK